MVTTPKRHGPDTTTGDVRRLFDRDDHVHAALIVSDTGQLIAVVERDDATGRTSPDAPAAAIGHLDGRTIAAEADLDEAYLWVISTGKRRLAVIGPDGTLAGLLCLKQHRAGFCSDHDVRARAAGHIGRATAG